MCATNGRPRQHGAHCSFNANKTAIIICLDSRLHNGKFILPFRLNEYTQFISKAFQLGLYGPKYQWFVIGYYTPGWWARGTKAENLGCNSSRILQSAEGYMTVTWSMNGRIDKTTVSGKVIIIVYTFPKVSKEWHFIYRYEV